MMMNEFIIGLGGVGGRSVQEFRRAVVRRKGDYASVCKQGARFEYLYIDSDTDILDSAWRSEDGMSIALGANQIIRLRSDHSLPDIEDIIKSPNIKPWIGDFLGMFSSRFISRVSVNEVLNRTWGAAQLRRFGRMLFALNANRIRNTIKQKLDYLNQERGGCTNFHIFCSLGGGTGSGCLVDLITLIKSIMHEEVMEDANIYVYAYVAGMKAESCDIGSFYDNQYCTLRDLNALIVGAYQPFITGRPAVNERDSYFNLPCPITRVYLSSDLADGCPNLTDQVVSMTSSCFDSIIYKYKYSSIDCLRAISGEDIVDVTPGEQGMKGDIARSYRFSTMGTAAWRVPMEQIDDSDEDKWETLLGDKVQELMANIRTGISIWAADGLMFPLQSPVAAIVIGLPAEHKNPKLMEWVCKKLVASMPLEMAVLGGRIDFYTHETPDEIRVLYVPYWFPCRFAAVTDFIENKYRKTLEVNDISKIYFANCDASGMDIDSEFNRPPLTTEWEKYEAGKRS